MISCPNCAVPMRYHRKLRKMVCHYCLEASPLPQRCPACHIGSVELMGMGTERLEEELKSIFSGHTIARMDSDVMKRREDYEVTLDAEGQRAAGHTVAARLLDGHAPRLRRCGAPPGGQACGQQRDAHRSHASPSRFQRTLPLTRLFGAFCRRFEPIGVPVE